MTGFSIDLADESATHAFGAALAAVAEPGDAILLDGDLGAGKTVFARGFVQAAVGDDIEVPSPTFTLAQIYPRDGLEVWHFDLYRLERAEEAWELGVEEAFAEGLSLIEWPERLGPLLPAERLDIRFEQGAAPGTRRARLNGHGRWAARLAELFPESAG